MIILEQGESRNIVLTLNEVCSISNPYYVFEFTNLQTDVSKVFTGIDISTNTVRYNEFVIELNATEDLENSVINLEIDGFYTYNVYSTVAQNDLDLANTTELVESGKVHVNGNTNVATTTYQGSENITKIVYNG